MKLRSEVDSESIIEQQQKKAKDYVTQKMRMLFNQNKKKVFKEDDDDSFRSDEDEFSSYDFSDSQSDKNSTKPQTKPAVKAEQLSNKINRQISVGHMKKQTRKMFTPEGKPSELELFDVKEEEHDDEEQHHSNRQEESLPTETNEMTKIQLEPQQAKDYKQTSLSNLKKD